MGKKSRIVVDAVVDEIVRYVDDEVCEAVHKQLHPNFRKRYTIILDQLEAEQWIKRSFDQSGARWSPNEKIQRIFGVERHGLPDATYAWTPRSWEENTFLEQVSIYCRSKLDGIVIATVTTLFGMYRLGALVHCGRSKSEGLLWKQSPTYDRISNEWLSARHQPPLITEIVKSDGTTSFVIE